MNKANIELFVRLNLPLAEDDYGDSVVAILMPPKWYHPIKRRKFIKEQPRRIRLVMGEYAKELFNALSVSTNAQKDDY